MEENPTKLYPAGAPVPPSSPLPIENTSFLRRNWLMVGIGVILVLALIESSVFYYYFYAKKSQQVTNATTTAASLASKPGETATQQIASSSNPVVSAIEQTEKAPYVRYEDVMVTRFVPGGDKEIENAVPLKMVIDSVFDNVSGNYKTEAKSENIFNNATVVQYDTMHIIYLRSDDNYYVNVEYGNAGKWMVFDPKATPNPPPSIAALLKTNYKQTIADLKTLYKPETVKLLGPKKVFEKDAIQYQFEVDTNALDTLFTAAYGHDSFSYTFSPKETSIIFSIVEEKVLLVELVAVNASVTKTVTKKPLGSFYMNSSTLFDYPTQADIQKEPIIKPSGTITSLVEYINNPPTPQ